MLVHDRCCNSRLNPALLRTHRFDKMAKSPCEFVSKRTKTLALRFFFNEAFRPDAQTYSDRKHQSAPCVSVQNSCEPARHFGLSAAGLPPVFAKTLSRFVFARRTERLRRCNLVCRG